MPQSDQSLSAELLARVCEVVDQFENAWHAGLKPQIADFVPETSDAEFRRKLLGELVHIDCELRLNAGENVSAEEYRQKFDEITHDTGLWDSLQTVCRRFQHKKSAINSSDAKTAIGPGSVIGDYEIIQEIARGGMGVVFKAKHRKLKRIVALKMILMGDLATSDLVERFLAEAKAAARLEHPGIVPVYEIGQHGTQHFFAMQFVEGQTLAQRLQRGPIKTKLAAKLVRQIARAVNYAHENGIVHRDIKPGNILITPKGHPKITDFGLAKQLDASVQLSMTGEILGTPSYMAPEQAAGQIRMIGPATDVYALGALLYAMLTGKPPFQAGTPLATLQQVLTQEPVAPRTLVEGLSLDLDTICVKCLQKDPAKRYPSAEALGGELQRFLDGDSIDARPIGWWERTVRWCRREPRSAALIALTTLLLVVIAVVTTKSALRHAALQTEVYRLAKMATEEAARADREVAEARKDRDLALFEASQTKRDQTVESPRRDLESDKTSDNPVVAKANDSGESKRLAEPVAKAKTPGLAYVNTDGNLRIHRFGQQPDETITCKDRVLGIQWLRATQRLALVTENSLVDVALTAPHETTTLRQFNLHTHTYDAALNPVDNRLAWCRNLKAGTAPEIVVSTQKGDGERNLGFGYDPVWTKDGRGLVFLIWTGSGEWRIGIYEGDFTSFRTIPVPVHENMGVFPFPSPDGDTIAFGMKDQNGTRQIGTVSVDGKVVRQLTRQGNANSQPSYSPDGRSIAFLRGENPRASLILLDVETGQETILADDAWLIRPAWCDTPDASSAAAASVLGVASTLERWLIPTAENGGHVWDCFMSQEQLPKDWPGRNDDGRFAKLKSAFGNSQINGVNYGTSWTTPFIYLRTTFELPKLGQKRIVLRHIHDDDAWIYVNGEFLDLRPANEHAYLWGYSTKYNDLKLTPQQSALFREGKNTICVHCVQNTEGQVIDIGLKLVDQSKLTVSASSVDREAIELATAETRRKAADTTIAILRKQMNENPSNPHTQINLGIGLGNYGRFVDAEEPLERAWSTNPELFNGTLARAMLLIELGKTAESRKVCQGMLTRFRQTQLPQAAEMTAKACCFQSAAISNYGQALVLIDRAKNLNAVQPAGSQIVLLPWILLTRMTVLFRKGDLSEALEQAAPIFQWHLPDSGRTMPHYEVQARFVRCLVLAGLDQKDAASEEFNRAEQIYLEKRPKPDEFSSPWVDWLFCKHLHREAAEKLGIQRNLPAADVTVPSSTLKTQAPLANGQAPPALPANKAGKSLGTVPMLIFPKPSDTMPNGTVDGTTAVTWKFDWDDVPKASKYHLFVKHNDAMLSQVDRDDIVVSQWEHQWKGYTGHQSGWTWKVRAFVNGKWSAWSDEQPFQVELLRAK